MGISAGSMGGSSMGGVDTTAGTTPSSPTEAAGANTFGSLKGLFKQNPNGPKKCKHCGTMFTPKSKATKV